MDSNDILISILNLWLVKDPTDTTPGMSASDQAVEYAVPLAFKEEMEDQITAELLQKILLMEENSLNWPDQEAEPLAPMQWLAPGTQEISPFVKNFPDDAGPGQSKIIGFTLPLPQAGHTQENQHTKEDYMPPTAHVERHFTASNTIRDIVIGMSDGLTVPFALAAGLSGAVNTTAIIVTAGLAEIAAGSIAMGLGGYLAARSDVEHYASERIREETEVRKVPEIEAREVAEVFQSYGLTVAESKSLADALRKRPKAWVDFMMRFELGLEEPDPKRALTSASTIAGAYIVGGFIPLGPYIFIPAAKTALIVSIIVTLIALAVFGYIKGRFTGAPPLRSASQTMIIGGLAATAAFLIARAIS